MTESQLRVLGPLCEKIQEAYCTDFRDFESLWAPGQE